MLFPTYTASYRKDNAQPCPSAFLLEVHTLARITNWERFNTDGQWVSYRQGLPETISLEFKGDDAYWVYKESIWVVQLFTLQDTIKLTEEVGKIIICPPDQDNWHKYIFPEGIGPDLWIYDDYME